MVFGSMLTVIIPVVIFAGFVVTGYVIYKRGKKKNAFNEIWEKVAEMPEEFKENVRPKVERWIKTLEDKL